MTELIRPDAIPNITCLDNLKSLDKVIRSVMWVPTHFKVVDTMLRMTSLTKNDVLYDLGCGDGRIIVEAARQYGCRAIGFERDAFLIKRALERIRKHKVEHLVSVKQADILRVDLSGATAVTMYLIDDLNNALRPQLEHMWKVKPNARVVTHQYDIAGYVPSKILVHPKVNKDPQFGENPQGVTYLYHMQKK
jgi:precorrin-6B methylase 2